MTLQIIAAMQRGLWQSSTSGVLQNEELGAAGAGLYSMGLGWYSSILPHTSLDRAEQSWVAAAEQIPHQAHLLRTD